MLEYGEKWKASWAASLSIFYQHKHPLGLQNLFILPKVGSLLGFTLAKAKEILIRQ